MTGFVNVHFIYLMPCMLFQFSKDTCITAAFIAAQKKRKRKVFSRSNEDNTFISNTHFQFVLFLYYEMYFKCRLIVFWFLLSIPYVLFLFTLLVYTFYTLRKEDIVHLCYVCKFLHPVLMGDWWYN